MEFRKPEKLIELFKSLISSEKSEKRSIIDEVYAESMRVEFRHYPTHPFEGILYKKMLWFGTRDYLHSDFSKETEEALREVIDLLEKSEIILK